MNNKDMFGESEESNFLQFIGINQENDSCQMLQDFNMHNDNNFDMKSESQVKIQPDEEDEGERVDERERKTKDKKKVFYRDKMAGLLKADEYVKQEYNYIAYSNSQKGKIPIDRDEQLKRNRESAKNSRHRKKQYMGILQKKNYQNLKLIDELTEKLKAVTQQRDRLKEDGLSYVKNFIVGKNQAYSELNKTIEDPLKNDEEIKNKISEMLVRFGASGTERLSLINYHMNEIVEIILSDVHKYFINCSFLSEQFPHLNREPKKIDVEVMKVLNLDSLKVSQILQKYSERFYKESCVFKNLTQDFYRIFKSIECQGRVIEKVFHDLIHQMDCRKVGELILWFEENKYCRDVKKIRSEWIELLQKGEEPTETVLRKQTKQN